VEGFLDQCVLLNMSRATARLYATIREALAKKGKPIPEADLWIAATAVEHGNLPLLSADAHFDAIPDFIRYDWREPMPKPTSRRKP
jgi:tRNA(fMet)-specific endonuclease VapC